MKIKYVDYGLASRFEDRIEIHKDLKKYPKLLKKIKEHEKNHTDKAFSLKDLLWDLQFNDINNIDLLKFILKRPSTWISILPIYLDNKGNLIYDLNACIIWTVGLIIIGIFLWNFFKFI